MGNKPTRPDTLDPAMFDMIERYVRDALKQTGTARPPPAPARDRLARASEAPLPPPASPFQPIADPSIAARDAIELSRELEAAMSIGARPSEFVDETPTDTCDPPDHVLADDEATGVYARPRH